MNTKSIGERSEAMLLARFLQLGYIVLQPFGDNQRYDLVIDRGSGFERVQIKTARLKKGALSFNTASTYGHRGGKRKGYVGQVEFFGVYSPDLNLCYLVPIDEAITKACCNLRIEAPKNGQDCGVRWARDFEI